jgi:S-adenosyl-L-methionine hydrolase (adenosine-forming)
VFAPVAAYLSKGVDAAKFGEEIQDYVRFLAPRPKAETSGIWKAVVLKADKFGNLITNITPNDIPQLFNGSSNSFKITVGKVEVTRLCSSYSEAAAGELVAILGSSGLLEISANKAAASRLAGADKGAPVNVTLGGSH